MSFLNYDSSVFYLIGSGIKHGLTPYIDLADHKGIYIFLVNYIGTLISDYKYVGMFIVSLFVNYIYLLLIYKLAILLSNDKLAGILSALSIYILAVSYFFCHGGMKCETLLAPMIIYMNYKYLEHVLSKSDKEFGNTNILLMGIFVGIIVFTKANLAICFLPIIIMITLDTIKNGQYMILVKYFLLGLLGILIGGLPAIIYAILNSCFKEMIYYTFTVNAIYSKGLYYDYDNIFEALINTFVWFKEVIILSIVSVILCKKKFDGEVFKFIILTLIANMLASFMALRPYTYHSYPLLFNLLFLFVFAYDKLLSIFKKHRIPNVILIAIFSIASVFYLYFMSYRENIMHGYKQYLVNKKMENYYEAGDDILVIGEAIGVYNYFKTFPVDRNFCTPHIERKYINSIYSDLLKDIHDKKTKWVITSFTPIMLKSGFADEVNDTLKENYNFVSDIVRAPAAIYKVK